MNALRAGRQDQERSAAVPEALLHEYVAVYLFIAATQIQTRRRMGAAEAEELTVRMWGFPYLPALVVLILIGIVTGLAFDPGSQRSLLLSGLATAVALVAGVIKQLRSASAPALRPETGTLPTEPESSHPQAPAGA